MTYKLNPFTGKLDTSDGPQGPAGVVSAAGPGSQGSPSISFAADLDTGLYNYTPNGIAVSTAGTGRLFIDANGNVGIGTTSPDFTLDVNGSIGVTEGGVVAWHDTSGNLAARVYGTSTDELRFEIGSAASRALTIDSSGRLLVGTSTARANFFNATVSAQFQQEGTGGTSSGTAFIRTSNDISSHNLIFAKSRGTTPGSNTIVSNADTLGYVSFQGNDGSEFIDSASISAQVDGTPGSNDMPGRLVFSTTADGNSAPNPRMTIKSDGNVGIGTTSPSGKLTVDTVNAATNAIVVAASTETGRTYGLGVNASAAFVIHEHTAASDRLVIDSSGRLLVGTSSSPSAGLGQYAHLVVQGYVGGPNNMGTVAIQRGTDAYSSGAGIGRITFNNNSGGTYGNIECIIDGTPGANDYPGRLVFSTTADGASSPTERITLKSDGRCVFSSVPDTTISRSAGGTPAILANSSSGLTTAGIEITTDSTATRYCQIFTIATTVVGSITTSGSATAYNTSSDYRLKENVTPVTDGITRLQQLNPSRFNFISNPDTTVDGFIAHEVQTIVPEAITGEKDAVDDNGNPVYQGIDQSKLVPLLTAALQEAIAKIETLEQRLTDAGL